MQPWVRNNPHTGRRVSSRPSEEAGCETGAGAASPSRADRILLRSCDVSQVTRSGRSKKAHQSASHRKPMTPAAKNPARQPKVATTAVTAIVPNAGPAAEPAPKTALAKARSL